MSGRILTSLLFLLPLFCVPARAELKVDEIKRDKPVDFQEEILPFLRANCLACHNRTRSKGEVVMETPDDIRKGNEGGPYVEAGNAEESFLFQLAAHTDEPIMPPAKNKVGAKNLTPGELGLLKLWIDQGAKGTMRARQLVTWQAYQRENPPIYATAVNRGGRFAAAGRGNRIHLYDLSLGSKQPLNLADPSLAKFGFYGKEDAAHLDVVNSLAFSPDGETLASGGYRAIKLWKKSPATHRKGPKLPLSPGERLALSAGNDWAASFGEGNGTVLWSLPDWKKVWEVGRDAGLVTAVAIDPKAGRIAIGNKAGKLFLHGLGDGKLIAEGNSTHASPVTALAFSHGETPSLVAARENKLIEAWPSFAGDGGTVDWAPLREFKGHAAAPNHLAFHPADENVFFSAGEDSSVRSWKFREGNLVKSVTGLGPVKLFALSPDGTRFAVSGTAPGASLWDFDTGKKITDLKGNPANSLRSGQAERELTFAKGEQTYFKGEVKKRSDERKKVEDRQKKVEKDLKDAEAKPIAEKKMAMEKARSESEAAGKDLEMKEESLVLVGKGVPEAEALEKKRAEELKKRIAALVDPEKKEKAALAEIAKLEKALKAQEAANAQDKVEEALKSLETARGKSDLAVKEAERLRKEKKVAEELAAQAKQKHAQSKKELDELKKAIATAKADLKKKDDALVKAEKEYQDLENPRVQFARDLERAKEDLVKADRKIKDYEAAEARADEELKQIEESAKQAKDDLAEDAKRLMVSLSFSGDGKTLLTLDDSGLATLWSGRNEGRWIESHQVPGKPARVLGWNQKEAWILDEDGHFSTLVPSGDWILDRVIGGDLAQTPIVHRVTALAFSADGRLLASGGRDPSRTGEVLVWDLAENEAIRHFPDLHSDVVNSVEFSRDGKRLVSGGADKFARVTDRDTGEEIHSFEGHTSLVLGASMQANGRILASVGADGEVKVWNLVNGDRAGKQGGYAKEITSIRFLGLTDQAFVTTAEKRARILRIPLGNPANVRDLSGAVDVLHAGGVSIGGGVVAAGGESGVLRVWKVADGKLIASFEPPVTDEVAKAAE